MNYDFSFLEQVFLFEEFTPKYNNSDNIIKKIDETNPEIMDKEKGLLMILRKCNFGFFQIVDLENQAISEITLRGNYLTLIQKFKEIIGKENQLVKYNKNDGIIGINRIGYLATDINLVLGLENNGIGKRILRV